jgi:hypothetical protein
MGNYPPGGIQGSGSNARDVQLNRECTNVIEFQAKGREDEKCEFSGVVDAIVDDFGQVHWECPLCGYEYEEDGEEDPDE